MTIPLSDAYEVADRADEARQADDDARCEHGVLWWHDCEDCWAEDDRRWSNA